MSDLIKENYKIILKFTTLVILLLLSPVLIEMIFKSGNIVGTMIRTIGTNGVCF